MNVIGKCELCGKLISYHFPIHECSGASPDSPNYVRRPKLSKWWKTKSAKAAFKRVAKERRARFKVLRKLKKPSSQTVRQASAKRSIAGSIPASASTQNE